MNLETCRAATSGTSAYRDDDEDVEDTVTSNPGMTFANLSLLSQPFCWSTEFWRLILFAAPPHVIDLLDDDEDVPLRPMGGRSKKTSTDKVPHSTLVTEPVIQETGDANRASMTFAVPLSSAQHSASTIQIPADTPSSLTTRNMSTYDLLSVTLEELVINL